MIAVRWTSITIVKSAEGNKNRRDAIRETWGKVRNHNGIRFITVFLLGLPVPNSDEKIKYIQREHDAFSDILLMDLSDTAE